MANEIQEIRYQVGEAWKGAYNVATVYGNAAVVQDPTGLSVYRSLKPGNVGHALSETSWWFCIINLSSIKEAADNIAATDAEVEAHEAARVSAEQQRVSQETARVNAETARIQAEQTRASQESARISQEQTRVNQEQVRVAQEETRRLAENSRLQAEEQRVSKETLRVNAEQQRALAEQNRAAAEQERVNDELDRVQNEQTRLQRASQDHQTAVSDHETAVHDNEVAEADHETAVADHTTAVSDHTRAESDHTRAQNDHTTAAADHTTATEDHTASVAATAAANEAAENANAMEERLLNGEVVPAKSANLESWEGEEGESEYVQTSVADTTGGTLSIDSEKPANLLSVVPASDFGATALVATGFNLLRFATAVGAGWYILVPKLTATAASIGTAQENNGMLFTDAQGNNLRPTVRFKALADGVPTGVTDGVVATYVDADGRRHYTTSGIGYLIVSDINRATTCMHLAWSRRYDEYVAVDAAGDAGATVNLAAGINALHDFGLMLQIGALSDSIERTSASRVTWYRRVDRVQPTWTNTPVEEEGVATGQYLHEALISNMRPDGAAAFMGSDQALSVTGTTVSYTDGNAEALTNYVKFELAAVVSGTASVSSSFAVEDWGLVLVQGATGTAAFTIAYAQGIPDNLRTALPQLNAIRTTSAAISLGQGICSTDTYTKDKVVTIPNFLLLLNGHIDVLFTTPINTDMSTLNVSNTGAKPVRILGQNLPAGVVKAQTYATLVYDGTAWNIVNLFCPGAEYNPAGLLVDMGLPSGVKWAARDIDLTKPGGFCDTPFVYEKSFFSWGNIDGHNPISNSAFSYNWGAVNEQEPWYEGQPYGSTPGNTLTGNIAVGEDFDAARANLGSPWRMPTMAEFTELFANIIYIDANGDEVDTTQTDKLVTVNGVLGLYIQSKLNGARLFFSCSGYGNGRSWSSRGSIGDYWSSAWYSARSARYLSFVSGGVYPQSSNNRYYGFALRPVQ